MFVRRDAKRKYQVKINHRKSVTAHINIVIVVQLIHFGVLHSSLSCLKVPSFAVEV